MRKIRAINGKYIKVSDCDYDFLRQFHWCQRVDGYFVCSNRGIWLGEQVNNKPTHWFIMKLASLEYPENMTIDHRDRDQTNNTLENLRFATAISQSWNRGLSKNNKTGLKGVHARGNRWRSVVSVGGKKKCLGTSNTKKEAYALYMIARVKLENYEPTWASLKLQRCTDLEVTRRVKSSKYIGVHKNDKKWVAQIRINGHQTHLGRYATEEQASEAYQKAKRDLCPN